MQNVNEHFPWAQTFEGFSIRTFCLGQMHSNVKLNAMRLSATIKMLYLDASSFNDH